MKKIPTVFERDWDGDRSRVLDKITLGCEWVAEGEGIATRKYDGTCCLVSGGKLFKRHEVRPGKATPDGFELVDDDAETGKLVGWVPVGDGPEDKWHRDAFDNDVLGPGTYELLGPKIQGNPEKMDAHVLIAHAKAEPLVTAPRDFAGLAAWFVGADVEGIVWHHPDGRMAKIKARDFGLRRRT